MTQLAFEWPGTPGQLDLENDREQIRAMELRTYGCGVKRAFHAPHSVEGMTLECPGLRTRPCGQNGPHNHHRWAEPDAFYWCQPFDYMHRSEVVKTVSRRR